MKRYISKTQKKKNQYLGGESSKSEIGSESSFQLVDNRPEVLQMKSTQEAINNSPRMLGKMPLFAESGMETSPVQMSGMEKKGGVQMKAGPVQRVAEGEFQMKKAPVQKKENNTGLPDNLKSGMEGLSGIPLDDVKVHRNSDKPAQLQAHAYAQGTDIHLGPGQEKHLPHEAWHVVQQKQGRVKPTIQMKEKVNVNDDARLEKEADVMGARALAGNGTEPVQMKSSSSPDGAVIQREDGEKDKTGTTSTILSTVTGVSGDTIEAGGNFFELISDAYAFYQTYKAGETSKVAGAKAAGSGLATLSSALKANEWEKLGASLEGLSEGLKLFDALKEVGEAFSEVNVTSGTWTETFESLGKVLFKFSDVAVGGMKMAKAFVEGMGHLAGWVPKFLHIDHPFINLISRIIPFTSASELALKSAKFMDSARDVYNNYVESKNLEQIANSITDPDKKQAFGYLQDEAWSKLKNSTLPASATLLDASGDAGKLIPGFNVAAAASLGSAAKLIPLAHSVGGGTYDVVRQGWRKFINILPDAYTPDSIKSLAATDKADLNVFRTKIVSFVMDERNGSNSDVILNFLGLEDDVKTMSASAAEDEIKKAVENIK